MSCSSFLKAMTFQRKSMRMFFVSSFTSDFSESSFTIAEPVFIFDVGYDMKRLDILVRKHSEHLEFTLNPAFWPALGVGPS